MVALILIEIVAVPAERSRGRHNRRVVKRKMSGFMTKARAAPVPRRVFRYEDHIRVMAPAGSPERPAPPPAAPPPGPLRVPPMGGSRAAVLPQERASPP